LKIRVNLRNLWITKLLRFLFISDIFSLKLGQNTEGVLEFAKLNRNTYFCPKFNIMQALTIEEIRQQYPDQWVLIGNPIFKEPDLPPTAHQLIEGVVLLADTDKRALALKAHDARQGYERISCIWTGEFPKMRRWITPFFRRIN
jgi:hypothetical protein